MRPLAFCVLSALASMSCGCGGSGEKNVKFAAYFEDKGRAVKLYPDETLTVILEYTDDKGDSKAVSQTLSDDGSVVFGADGKGGPPANSKVKIALEYNYDGDKAPRDRFTPRFGQDVSRLIFNLGPEMEQEVVVDLNKQTVTKK